MAAKVKNGTASIVPALRYRDAPAAIRFLRDAFGFTEHLVVPGPNDTIVHAELALGYGMIMLGSGHGGEFDRYMKAPDGGPLTQTVYVIVADPDAHYARAKSAGAEILMDIKTEDYGGRGYTCRDPQGHIWTFGSYDPWSPPK
jgi:uncharacterized glyoxalase superfamily protein PhnB